MFEERRFLLDDIWIHYKSLADRLGEKTLVDEHTMKELCPSDDELLNIGVPGDACGQDFEVKRVQDPVSGETKISIEPRPGMYEMGIVVEE